MALAGELPCDGDGNCMGCKKKPPQEEILTCKTCATPWHVNCLASGPEILANALQWECPDCSSVPDLLPLPMDGDRVVTRGSGSSSDLIAAIRAIELDRSLTEREKAKRRQELMCREARLSSRDDNANSKKEKGVIDGDDDILGILDSSLNCSFCMQLPERPVTTPCGHNFCLKCFQKWIGQGKRTCANCRNRIPANMASYPRINSALVIAIRIAKMTKSNAAGSPTAVYHFVRNQDRPDKAFTSERAKKGGKANASSGKIFVTVPPDHLGPILAENDPERSQGVLVGETWEDRLECRQWGIHLPPVAGIAGQSSYGAQSVVLSGGYQDDEDHGEWFLYTGSGGRDLSGNKRTNKEHSFDQQFEKLNEALRVSCRNGYPVRVVRSDKERSSYAPERGLRYDGIYRTEMCWRKNGIQGYKVCRYLFVRCDNDPAPWTSDDIGDLPRALPVIKELKNAIDKTERKGSPSWDYDEEKSCWMWKKPPPCSRKQVNYEYSDDGKTTSKVKRKAKCLSTKERLLKEFSCHICRKVMASPLTTPCAHNFCKACLEGAFAGQTFLRQRTCEGRRTLRAQKRIMKCPVCPTDIADFLQNPQVNRELMELIESLQSRILKEENVQESNEETNVSHGMVDEIADNIETCRGNCTILEDAKDTAQIEKLSQTEELKKATGSKCTSTKQSDAADGKNIANPLKPEKADSNKPEDPTEERKVEQTGKRKQYKREGDSRVMTRSMRARYNS